MMPGALYEDLYCVRGAKPRTASASSSRCSPIAHHRRRCRPISCGCRSLQWPTCWSTLCVVSACVIPNSPTHRSRPFALKLLKLGAQVRTSVRVAFISPSPPDAPTRLSSRSRTSIFGARLAPPESYLRLRRVLTTPLRRVTPMHGQKHTHAGHFAATGLALREPPMTLFSNPSTRPLATVEPAADRRAHPTKTALV